MPVACVVCVVPDCVVPVACVVMPPDWVVVPDWVVPVACVVCVVPPDCVVCVVVPPDWELPSPPVCGESSSSRGTHSTSPTIRRAG